MLTLHHLNDSRSQRILWLLEELGTPHDIVRYQRDAATRLAPPELLQVHPLGKSPVITDGDITVAESGAFVEYLLDPHRQGPGLGPAGGRPAAARGGAARSPAATPTGCTSPRAAPCRPCCSSWCSRGSRAHRCRS